MTDPISDPSQPRLVQPLALDLAPPARPKNLVFIVILCGVASTMAALLGVWALRKYGEEDIMGWYANRVLPAGAVIVGIVAGVGYGVSSWLTGVKIRKSLLFSILGIQFAAYWAAKYVDFSLLGDIKVAFDADGNPTAPTATNPAHVMGFFEFYHFETRMTAFKSTRNYGSSKSSSEPLGGWGYAFRGLEIIGFISGSFLVPIVMAAKPYCDVCQVYKRKRPLARLAASLTHKETKAGTGRPMPDGTIKTGQDVATDATMQLVNLEYCIKQNDIDGFVAAVAALRRTAKDKSVEKLPNRLHIDVTYCPNCNYGILQPFAVSGKGNQVARTVLPETEIPRPLMLAILPILQGKKSA